MEQFLADKTRVLLRPHWLSKSSDTHQKIAPVVVVKSGVNGLLSRCKRRARGYDGDAAFRFCLLSERVGRVLLSPYWDREAEGS